MIHGKNNLAKTSCITMYYNVVDDDVKCWFSQWEKSDVTLW